LRREPVLPHLSGRLSTEDSGKVLTDLIDVLTSAGLLETEPADRAGTPGYALPAMALIWKAGDGTRGFHDPIRRPSIPEGGMSTNRYFVDLYRDEAERLQGLAAREHTAQVPNESRKEREAEFKEARLPILYASPTLELGVDIKELNVVNMRNVPPTPANYAQRSGRAGRNGQPALVLTYCSTFQSHDQYFFARPQQMVAGAVSPPRVDLLNEELLKAHIHAIWLGETGETLPPSIGRIVDIDDDLELPLNIDRRRALSVPGAKERTLEKAGRMLEPIREDLEKQPWYTADWLQKVLGNCLSDFDRACDRWRELYRAAKRQREYQHAILGDQSRPKQQQKHAAMLRRQAESQIDLLTQEHDVMQADFYTYRYLASEGFLPGYNFPRLPVTAYLPGQRGGTAHEGRDEFLSRARFLAISEFGPQALIYHEGSRYQINRLMLPLREESTELPLQSVKICTHCGYLHPVTGEEDADVCESCGETLPAGFGNLIQMTHVGTRRMQRINSDEEERQRRGYEVVTAVRYARSAAGKQKYTAEVTAEGYPVLRMEYGHAANLWRINLGWRRRGALEPKEYGFKLDVERGDWMSTTRAAQQSRTAHSATNASDTSDVDGDGEDGAVPSGERRIETVIPFVQDTRNALVLEPLLDTTDAERRVQQMASLQSAFKKAIQAVFDLEETELAAEPLPNRRGRKRILLYEAAEGGAGVLQRLLSEGDAIARVARTALEILHYDPDTGDDRRRGPTGEEDCEAACYDCLMTYANQRDHQLLDRTTVVDYLRELAAGELSGVLGPARPDRHLGRLEELCESELERRWLHYLDEHRLRLPDDAQVRIEDCNTRADFYYAEHHAVIYVDGPPHEYTHRQERDREQELCLEEAGYFVIRFGSETEWEQVVSEYWAVFGSAT
ncbi:MAG: helicase-related protein, partial [Armatimonadota bacterium]